MSQYHETSVAGAKWQRCRRYTLVLPYGSDDTGKLFLFAEEVVVVVDGAVVSSQPAGACSVAYVPAEDIPLRNPITDALTGSTMSQALLFQALFSLYRQTAEARDAG